jgi:hypothetical protein
MSLVSEITRHYERRNIATVDSEATVTLTEHTSRHGFGAVLPEEIGISVSGRGERSRGFAFQLRYAIAPAAALEGWENTGAEAGNA